MDRKRLGRGLESLISGIRQHDTLTVAKLDETPPDSQTIAINIKNIVPNPFQPRSDFNPQDIQSLAESIRTTGVLQPIIVRPKGKGFEIVAGERRWRAAVAAGLSSIPAVSRDASDEEMLQLALVENLQRRDLNPIDRAKAYQRYCTEFGISPEGVGTIVGEDRTTVLNYLRLLELSDPILGLISRERLSPTHARSLLTLADPKARESLAELAAKKQLSSRALDAMIRRAKNRKDIATADPISRTQAIVRDLEDRFQKALGTHVSIRHGKSKGTGRIIIEYYNHDDFERIAKAFNVK